MYGCQDGNNYCFGLYDVAGNQVTPANWRTLGNSHNDSWDSRYNDPSTRVPSFSDGKAMVQNANGLYGLIDTEGNLIVEVRWSEIRDFTENLTIVVENGLHGFIDTNAQVVIQPRYEGALSFSEGLAVVKTGGLWQYIDADNNVVISPKYGEATSFADGRADVFLPGTGWQIINNEGRLLYFVSEQTVSDYNSAKALMASGDYAAAYEAFVALAGYQDADYLAAQAEAQRKEADYLAAKALLDAGAYREAFAAFAALSGYRDADELAAQTVDHLAAAARDAMEGRGWLAAGSYHTACLRLDGTVVAVDDNEHGQCGVSGWSDIVAVAAGSRHTVGLKADGTVAAVGWNKYGQCDVSGWTSVGGNRTLE